MISMKAFDTDKITELALIFREYFKQLLVMREFAINMLL